MSNKIIKIIGYVVFGLSAIVILHFFLADVGGLDDGLAKMQDLSPEMKIDATEELANGWGGWILNFSGILFALCAIATIGFAIWQFIKNIIEKPKKARTTGIIVLGTVAIVLISYFMASDAIPVFLGSDQIEITPSTSKWIETFLYVMYIVFGLSIVATIYNEISRVWK
ncbi:MAG TPA: hypothetical protein PLL66_03005 [Bacteroidales bacterium]|nr:hypothetical protein [Bacteroidales bacterium]